MCVLQAPMTDHRVLLGGKCVHPRTLVVVALRLRIQLAILTCGLHRHRIVVVEVVPWSVHELLRRGLPPVPTRTTSGTNHRLFLSV